MTNKVEDLREHLFATLEALRDKDKPMELDRARAISEVAQTIINRGKVEVDYAKVVGRVEASSFLPAQVRAAPPTAPALPRAVK
jgi:hypothetical protein